MNLEGDWVGGLEVKDTWLFIKAHFNPQKNVKTVIIPQKDIHKMVPIHFKAEPPNVYIEVEKDSQTFIFDGQVKDNTIVGDVTQSGEKGTFQLFRVADIEGTEDYFGLYKLETDRLILFGKRWSNTVYLEERRVVNVYPLTDATFFSEMGETIIFKDKRANIIWRQKDFEISGTKVTLYREEDVTFRNKEVTLSGTLALPVTEGPHPAVVLIHGSGAESREGYHFLADHLARHGIAALRYDKRGTGTSTGDWHYSTLKDLAEDTLAGVHLLQTHKDIHPEKIGLLGTSQGAWIAPIAASRSQDVAFTVFISGAAVSPKKQELYRVEHELHYLGFSPFQVDLRVLGYRLQLFIAKIFQKIQKVLPVSKILPKDIVFALYLDWDFDVTPYLKKVTCPVLAVYGELDKTVPVQKSAAILEKALENHDFTMKIFPKGNHALLESEAGAWSEVPRLKEKEFVPGYYDLISSWIAERTNK
ncbi:MAG: hypothetical protein AYK19_06720 [Theionarchaea archaeon DG-70-1]|nr:MAG: hypothetical protein AYK19_06720 [Theionarchaea archaeon DG-70-1]